ncbi:exodeoxyribonuclease VII small subunit [Acidobacteriota bacterium]
MAEQNFEKALEELEGIVHKLEEGDFKLNESLKLFEKGVKLARFLREELEKAERKIEILLKDEKGEVKSEPFDFKSTEEIQGNENSEEDPESGENSSLPF